MDRQFRNDVLEPGALLKRVFGWVYSGQLSVLQGRRLLSDYLSRYRRGMLYDSGSGILECDTLSYVNVPPFEPSCVVGGQSHMQELLLGVGCGDKRRFLSDVYEAFEYHERRVGSRMSVKDGFDIRSEDVVFGLPAPHFSSQFLSYISENWKKILHKQKRVII